MGRWGTGWGQGEGQGAVRALWAGGGRGGGRVRDRVQYERYGQVGDGWDLPLPVRSCWGLCSGCLGGSLWAEMVEGQAWHPSVLYRRLSLPIRYAPDLHPPYSPCVPTQLQKIYQEGTGFIPYKTAGEAPADRTEREWAEGQLRAERKKNMRLGITERLETTLARVQVGGPG